MILLVGPSGTGKSRTAHLLASLLGSVYFVPSPKGSGLYFDDYDGETSIILDEFDGNVMTPTAFNSLCDRYPYTLPSHGSAGSQMESRYIFVCSNYLPKYWWRKRSPQQVLQTTRRIEVTIPMLRAPAPPPRVIPCLMNNLAFDFPISTSGSYIHEIFQ